VAVVIAESLLGAIVLWYVDNGALQGLDLVDFQNIAKWREQQSSTVEELAN
jgi:hypothetical protein